MIQPNELRIGNWVKWPNEKEPNEVTWAHGHWLGVFEKNYSLPEPIPLTEDWLIRFGFIGDVNSGFGKDAIELNYITTDEHFEFEYKTSSKAWMLVPIKYVHQLQNLYYTLAGEELTISEPTKQQ